MPTPHPTKSPSQGVRASFQCGPRAGSSSFHESLGSRCAEPLGFLGFQHTNNLALMEERSRQLLSEGSAIRNSPGTPQKGFSGGCQCPRKCLSVGGSCLRPHQEIEHPHFSFKRPCMEIMYFKQAGAGYSKCGPWTRSPRIVRNVLSGPAPDLLGQNLRFYDSCWCPGSFKSEKGTVPDYPQGEWPFLGRPSSPPSHCADP